MYNNGAICVYQEIAKNKFLVNYVSTFLLQLLYFLLFICSAKVAM